MVVVLDESAFEVSRIADIPCAFWLAFDEVDVVHSKAL